MKKLYRTTEEINGHKFYRTYNFLPEPERKQLIKEVGPFIVNRPYVKDYGPVPGYNTPDDMQDNPIFKEFHKKVKNEFVRYMNKIAVIERSWCNRNFGDFTMWHEHPTHYATVYYLKHHPFFARGTMFNFDGEEQLIKSPQNCLLTFPGHLLHSVPATKFGIKFDRYCFAMDVNTFAWSGL